jgi:hypothetical protein
MSAAPFIPVEAENPDLRILRTWSPRPDDPTGWGPVLNLLQVLWNQDYGRVMAREDNHGHIIALDLVTGGWSENEELLGAVRANTLAWVTLWRSSHRGGRHVLALPHVP